MTSEPDDSTPDGLVHVRSLPQPWAHVVVYWIQHHPDRLFLPDLDTGEYLLCLDDLQDVLEVAGVLTGTYERH